MKMLLLPTCVITFFFFNACSICLDKTDCLTAKKWILYGKYDLIENSEIYGGYKRYFWKKDLCFETDLLDPKSIWPDSEADQTIKREELTKKNIKELKVEVFGYECNNLLGTKYFTEF